MFPGLEASKQLLAHLGKLDDNPYEQAAAIIKNVILPIYSDGVIKRFTTSGIEIRSCILCGQDWRKAW